MKIMGRRERKKLQSRQTILAAAVKQFTAQGVRETSIADIMNAADLGIGTFYNYFESKDAVLMCLLEGLVAELRTAVDELLQANRPASEVLESAVIKTGRLLMDNRFVLPLFLSAAGEAARPAGKRDKEAPAPAFKSIFQEIICKGQVNGEFRQDIPSEVVTEMFHSIFQAAAFSRLEISFMENVQLKVRLILSGLTAHNKAE